MRPGRRNPQTGVSAQVQSRQILVLIVAHAPLQIRAPPFPPTPLMPARQRPPHQAPLPVTQFPRRTCGRRAARRPLATAITRAWPLQAPLPLRGWRQFAAPDTTSEPPLQQPWGIVVPHQAPPRPQAPLLGAPRLPHGAAHAAGASQSLSPACGAHLASTASAPAASATHAQRMVARVRVYAREPGRGPAGVGTAALAHYFESTCRALLCSGALAEPRHEEILLRGRLAAPQLSHAVCQVVGPHPAARSAHEGRGGGANRGQVEARRAARKRNSFGVSSEWHNPETRARTERAGPALSRAARLWLLREERGAGRWARGVRIGRR